MTELTQTACHTFIDFLAVARAIGLSNRDAPIWANVGALKATGVDVLGMMGYPCQLLSDAELRERLDIVDIQGLLAEAGLLDGGLDLTPMGEVFGMRGPNGHLWRQGTPDHIADTLGLTKGT